METNTTLNKDHKIGQLRFCAENASVTLSDLKETEEEFLIYLSTVLIAGIRDRLEELERL